MSNFDEARRRLSQVEYDLLRAEGNYYVVREPGGHEVKFHIDRDTKLSGSPRIGDHLEAEVTPAGHARSVERR